MTEQDLIKRIKKLDKIQPSRHWLALLRRNLSAQIDFEMVREGRNSLDFGWFMRLQPMALAVSLTLILVLGPWLTLKASEPSLPGEFLYAVKRAGEDIQKTVASQESKTQLEVKFASRRLEELAKITGDSFSPEEKTEKTKQVMTNFKDNLAGFSQHVKGISSKEEAVVVAKKTKRLKENLDKTKEGMPIEVKGDIDEAEKTIKEISQDILAVLIDNGEENNHNATTTGIIDEEILIFLETVTSTDDIIEK